MYPPSPEVRSPGVLCDESQDFEACLLQLYNKKILVLETDWNPKQKLTKKAQTKLDKWHNLAFGLATFNLAFLVLFIVPFSASIHA